MSPGPKEALFPHAGKRRQALVKSTNDLSDSHFDAISPLEPTTPRMMVHVDPAGNATLVEANRIELAARMEVSQRDLRLTDPWVPMPYPTSVLIRKKAILINLESIRMVVSMNECLVMSVGRVTDEYIYTEEPTTSDSFIQHLCEAVGRKGSVHGVVKDSAVDYNLPFELRALEAALHEACRLLEVEVTGAISEASGKLAKFRHAGKMQRSCIDDLKVVRGVITRLVSRVGKLKSQLEEILDDDHDMLDLHLAHQETPAWTRQTSARTARELAFQHEHGAHARQSESSRPTLLGTLSAPAATHSMDRALSHVTEKPSLEQPLYDGSPDDSPHGVRQVERHRASFVHGRHGFLSIGETSSRRRSAQPPAQDDSEERVIVPQQSEPIELRGASASNGREDVAPVPLTSVQPPEVPSGPMLPSVAPATALQQVSARLEKLLDHPSALDDLMCTWPPGGDAGTGRGEEGGEGVSGLHDADDAKSMSQPDRWRNLLIDNLQELKEQARRHEDTPHVRQQDIQDVECMLEAYFVQADFFLIKLHETLNNMDDFQNSTNYELDRRRNELFAIQLIITIVTMAFGFIAAVAGIFGMNLDNVTNGIQQAKGLFYAVTVWSCVLGLGAAVLLLLYLRWKKMLFLAP